ncbi:hypothetical protein GOBAR_DD24252 [Gossypium barbadense]|nr:hypothetical protein GOBAR_DD24252 [Gossypium barbadense]
MDLMESPVELQSVTLMVLSQRVNRNSKPWSVLEVLRPLYEPSTWLAQKTTMAEISQLNITSWGRRPAALRALSHKLSKGFNKVVNGFTDEGWSMLESDGVDDVTLLVNSSPEKMMDINFSYSNGFPSMGNAVLCGKASMLLQNVPPVILLRFLQEHRSEWADSGIDAYSAATVKAGPCRVSNDIAALECDFDTKSVSNDKFIKKALRGSGSGSEKHEKHVALAIVTMRPTLLGPIMEKLSLCLEKYGSGRQF